MDEKRRGFSRFAQKKSANGTSRWDHDGQSRGRKRKENVSTCTNKVRQNCSYWRIISLFTREETLQTIKVDKKVFGQEKAQLLWTPCQDVLCPIIRDRTGPRGAVTGLDERTPCSLSIAILACPVGICGFRSLPNELAHLTRAAASWRSAVMFLRGQNLVEVGRKDNLYPCH